jgi:uncharacterized membrane protein YcaP (DUF421 family)
MESIIRGVSVYLIVWLILRLSGRRTFAEMTSFDFVLLLIIGESTQQALLGQDFSITNAALVVVTLVSMDIALSLIKSVMPRFEILSDGLPVLLIENGRLIHEHMKKSRVDEADILDEARKLRGLERLEQIKYAVLERNGGISIVPYHDGDKKR